MMSGSFVPSGLPPSPPQRNARPRRHRTCEAWVPESTYADAHQCLKRAGLVPIRVNGRYRLLCAHHRAMVFASRKLTGNPGKLGGKV